MTIYTEPSYGLAYADADTPVTDFAEITRQVALTLAAALARGGIAPPNAQDLIAVAARVTVLEQPAAYFYGTGVGNTSMVGSAWTDVPISEVEDTANGHAGTSPQYIAPTAGLYWVNGQCTFTSNNSGGRGARLMKRTAAGVDTVVQGSGQLVGTSGFTQMTVPTNLRRVQLAAGDSVRLQGWQNAATGLALVGAEATDGTASFLQVSRRS